MRTLANSRGSALSVSTCGRVVQLASVLLALLLLIECSTPRHLTEIDVSPITQGLQLGESVQYTAVGHFTRSPVTEDITTNVRWSSSNASVADFGTDGPAGKATAMGTGATTITASSTLNTNGGALVSGQAILNVQ